MGQFENERWGSQDPTAKLAADIKDTWIPIAKRLGMTLLRWHSDGNQAQFQVGSKTIILTRSQAMARIKKMESPKRAK